MLPVPTTPAMAGAPKQETGMKIKRALSILGVGMALTLSTAAHADGDRGRGWHGDRHHRHVERHHGYYDHGHKNRHYGYSRRHYAPPRVVHERVIIERPVYVAPRPPVYYEHYPRAPRYPGIVVNVDIPPFVIPLR
jgi:hypothetical protein